MSSPDRPHDNPGSKSGASNRSLKNGVIDAHGASKPSDPAVLDSDELDFDGDYELEAVDPEVGAPVRQFAEQQMSDAAGSLDVDQFYADYNRGIDFDNLLQDSHFRFQIRHLMLLTAGLAVVLALWKIANFAALLLITLVALGGAHVYFAYHERKRQLEVQARRDRLVEMMRNQNSGEVAAAAHDFEEAASELREENKRADIRLSFSMKQMMIAMTVACIFLGFVVALPMAGVASAEVMAGVLGVLAVIGIGVHAAGYDPPPVVALGWWLIMAMYVVLSIAGQFRAPV